MESVLITDRDMYNFSYSSYYDSETVRALFSNVLENFDNSLRDFTFLALNGYLRGVERWGDKSGVDQFDYLVASLLNLKISYYSSNTLVTNSDYPIRMDIDALCSELNLVAQPGKTQLTPETLYTIMSNYFTSLLRSVFSSYVLTPGSRIVFNVIEGGILFSINTLV